MDVHPDMDAQFASERARRIRDELAEDDQVCLNFVNFCKSSLSHTDLTDILAAFEFAKSIEYHHVGLSSAAYLSHPLRVATYALQESLPIDKDTVIIALLHNVLEVSDISSNQLCEKFGKNIADSIVTLTVDRKQTSLEYKTRYYSSIYSGYKGARVVKVLDKFDNIFMICFNPDHHVRKQYLEEIERFVLPMAERDVPGLSTYLQKLTATMKSFGYLDKKTEIAKISRQRQGM